MTKHVRMARGDFTMQIEKQHKKFKRFKRILPFVLIWVILASTMPSWEGFSAHADSSEDSLWLLEEGYLTLSKDHKSLVIFGEDGKEIVVYKGPIAQIWNSTTKLYFVNSESLAIVALDLKTLKWENIYYINDLNIAFTSENFLMMSMDTGFILIDLETLKETTVQGHFTKFSRGNGCFYAIDENRMLCQIGLDGKILTLGDIGDSEHYHLNQVIYFIDSSTGKLKSTTDTLNYRAISDRKVIAVESDDTGLFFLEENEPTTLKMIQEDNGKILSFKTPFKMKQIQIQGSKLLITDTKKRVWAIDILLLKNRKENEPLNFQGILGCEQALNDPEMAMGILTFRGGPLRQNSAFGSAEVKAKALKKIWSFALPAGKSKWGGGAGWTGQPLLVQWPQKMKTHMNILDRYKNDPKFVEVIQASLNGNVYFTDMATGKATRAPIKIGNPIKGTPSVDGRGIPLLYVGDGIPDKREAGFHIFSLIDQKELFFQKGIDMDSTRKWPAFDSSAIFDTKQDQLIVGGENGILYQFKLNTKYNEKTGELSVKPTKKIYKANLLYSKDGKVLREGIENSVAFYDNRYYFATNSGQVRCVDQNMKLVWEVNNYDDTDATVTVDIENGKPVIYTASEVDLQGEKGLSRILKIDGKTGKVIWKKAYTCYSKFGESPSNGGALATNIVGKNDIENVVIFNLARCEKSEQGSLFALDKKTGKQVWRKNMSTYAWSSPVAIYDNKGKSYILQNDRSGTVHLLEGISGKEVWKGKVDTYLESTPAVYNNTIVFSSRTGTLYGYQIF